MNPTRLFLSALTLSAVAVSTPAGPAVAAGPFQSPYNAADNFDTYRITACFDLDRSGSRADWTGWAEGDPTAGNGHAYDNHSGTDWGIATGTDLYACQDGTVNSLRDSVPNDDHSDTGNYLILDHLVSGNSLRSRYWHLAQSSIVPTGVGQPVTMGTKIAECDNTGNSTGAHLHFALSDMDESGLTTCGFFNGWFTQDEYYYGDTRPCLRYLEVTANPTLNVREGTSTGYDIITSVPFGAQFVASQRNGWYRFFLPSAPARAHESRTSGGGVSAAPDYVETGTWASSADKSAVADAVGDANRVTLAGAGGRRVAAASAATAQFVPDLTQHGTYEVFVTWPAQANATGVTYAVNHNAGSTDVVADQVPGTAAGGTGTHADPYIINANSYVANHTTIGGDDTWDVYSPTGAGIPEEGPERVYQFTLNAPATVTATVAHSGYSTFDVDVHLLDTLSNADCVARGDWSASYAFAAGTHCIAIDSYGTGAAGDARATAYTLTVDITGATFSDAWVSLGSWEFDSGQSAANGSVTIDASTAAGTWVYADAVKFVPTVWRSAWFSDGLVNVLDGAADLVCCVGIRTDATSGNDARSITDITEVPIHASPNASSAVVGKAVSGQRFVCDRIDISTDFYRVFLTNGCDQAQGWISGEHLFVYNPGRATSVPAGLTLLGIE